jgi:RND superfamily putative drug exporter
LNPYAPGYDGLPAELTALRTRIRDYAIDADEVANWLQSIDTALDRLRKGAVRLYDGTLRLKRGTKRLAGGAAELAAQAPELGSGLAELDGGLARLATGIDAIGAGSGALADGLSNAFLRSRPLARGLARADVRVRGVAPDVRRLRRDSPGFFDSGYFVLSALDGADDASRSQAAQSIDLERGGRAALMFVVPAYGFNTDGSNALNDKLRDDADDLHDKTGLDTAVAGGAALLSDYDKVTTARIPLVIAAITLITFLAMIVILRALPLAALAVGLNLVSVAAAFGILSLLSHVPEGLPLGGRTYLDAIGAAAIFGVVFGLSIDYAVFLLMRMRESYERDGDHLAAITYGLERTALVITGAAAIMAGVFIAFAGASVATVSQMGVGLTVAVILDATVIRLILLPALMRLIGERVWWLPDWLDRLLPHPNLEGPRTTPAG